MTAGHFLRKHMELMKLCGVFPPSPAGAAVVLRLPAQRQPPVAEHHRLRRHPGHRPQLVPQPGLHAHHAGGVPAADQRPQRRAQVHGAAAGAPLCCLSAHPGGR